MILSPIVSDFRDSASEIGRRFFSPTARPQNEIHRLSEFPKRLFSLYAQGRPEVFDFIFSGREPNTTKIVFSLLTEPEFSEQTDLTSTAFGLAVKLVTYKRQTLSKLDISDIRESLITYCDAESAIDSNTHREGFALMLGWAQLAEGIRKGHTSSDLGLTDSDLLAFCQSHYTHPKDYALGAIYYKREDLSSLSFVSEIDTKYFVT